jgi:hypothetical protein
MNQLLDLWQQENNGLHTWHKFSEVAAQTSLKRTAAIFDVWWLPEHWLVGLLSSLPNCKDFSH